MSMRAGKGVLRKEEGNHLKGSNGGRDGGRIIYLWLAKVKKRKEEREWKIKADQPHNDHSRGKKGPATLSAHAGTISPTLLHTVCPMCW